MREQRPLHVLVLAPVRHPLREPHAGGLEATVWERVRGLRRRGHHVTLCAPEGSDFLGSDPAFRLPRPVWPEGSRPSDITYPPGYDAVIEPALARAMRRIADLRGRVDVIDNHSLHAAPLQWASRWGIPLMTTLHTPPLEVMLDAVRTGRDCGRFFAVSEHTARSWARRGLASTVLLNAVDTDVWRPAPRVRDHAVWFGRIVPEKAPHLAIDAARRAGLRLLLAGRVGDIAYMREQVSPRLGPDALHVGALRRADLVSLVASAQVALVTPVWDEPFGLVLAEATATGTPVAAFGIGGVTEIGAGHPGVRTVPPGDLEGLARAALDLSRRSLGGGDYRSRVRAATVRQHSLEHRLTQIEHIHRLLATGPADGTGASRPRQPAVQPLSLPLAGEA